MKILIVHNRYLEGGGEDVVAAIEARLLAEHGHRIIWYERDNAELSKDSAPHGIALGMKTVWASDSYHAVLRMLRQETPDVAHFHNTFPLISPAAYYACARAGVPVVQTLHNYRLLCPGATLYRDGHTCEQCLGRDIPWKGIVHGCYRHDVLATAAVVAMLTAHRLFGSWDEVHAYIAASEFARRKFIQGGLPVRRIHVKPNFVHPDPHAKTELGDYALFVGRLCEEKGIHVLLDGWKRYAAPVPLVIAGDGPLRGKVSTFAAGQKGMKLLGPLDHDEILRVMHNARFLIFPSVLYEGAFPLSIVEAFACGVPVIASRLGSMADTIAHGKTGLHFSAGNSYELADRCLWAWNHPDEMQQMGLAARTEYEANYTAEKNYKMLTNIYESVRHKIAVDGEHHFLRASAPHAQDAR